MKQPQDILFQRLASKMESLEDVEFLEAYQELEAEENAKMMERNVFQKTAKLWAIGLVLLILLALLFDAIGVDASTPQLWMYLKQGSAGLDFYCTDTPPYADRQAMPESDYAPLALHPEDLVLYAQVVQVEFCNVDNLYEGNGNNPQAHAGEMFVWRFDHRVTDGNEANRHMTRGTAWIQLLDFNRNLND